MDTIYYRLNAARITVDGDRKVSGGASVRCVVVPKKSRPAPVKGNVLDFDAYRRTLAEDALPAAAEDESAPAAPKGRLSLWLLAEIGSSAAVVGFTALAALGVFLS